MDKIKYLLAALLLYFGLGVRADNVVTIGTASGTPGEEVMLGISLSNSDALSSLQLSIPLDGNLTLVDGSAQVGSRCAGHIANVGVKDGELQIVVYSLSMATITAGSGDVVSFKLKLGNEPVTVTLQPTKMVLTDGNGNTVNGSYKSGAVTIRSPKAEFSTDEIDFGRVPIRSTYTREVSVTNVGTADLVVSSLDFSDVNVFSTTSQLPKTITPGSRASFNVTFAPTERGDMEWQLRFETNSAIRNRAIRLKAQPYAVNELHIGDASGISDEEVTIAMRMNNMDDISGYQLDFELPNSLQYVDGSFAINDNRIQDHVGAASIVGGTLRLVAYSPSGKPLKGNDGEIGSFRVKLVGRNSVNLKPTKTVLSATINNKVENVVSDVYGGQVTIQYPAISTDGEINFGAVSVTEECKRTFTIRNNGNAPLTVSRIVFNNEHLSVVEAMPLVIQSWQSSNVTVVYNSTEQKAFEATMQIYNNDPDRRLHEVKVSGSRFAPNYMSLQVPNVFEDENVKANLSVNTYDNVTGLQFDMEYPNSVYEPFDGNIQLTERANGMTVNSRQMSPNTIRYVCYFLGGGGIAAGEGEIMSISLKPVAEVVPVGTYTVNIKNVKLGTAELADKYAGSDVMGSFQVKKHNPVTITAKSYTRLYGDPNPTFEYTSEGATIVGRPEFSCEATITSPVGVYPIHISKGTITNEEVTYVDGTLTIEKAPLTISAGIYTKKQGEENPEFILSYEGFKNNETKDVLTKQAEVVCEAVASSIPGEYPVTVSGAEARNYEISHVSGKLIVTDADPVTITANSYTITYGDAIPEFGYTSNGATLIGTPTISCEATSTSPVGKYPIVISKGSVTNYNDTYVNGVLTITKAPLTVSVGNYTKKQYDPMPEFSVTYEGFKNDETKDVLTKQPELSCEANEDSAPGEYPIAVSGAEAVNYQIQYVPGKLTVTEPDSYTLTYIVDGEVYQSFKIKYRERIVPLEAPTKEGYTFSGWSEIPETMPAHDVTVTGSFSINQYTVKFLDWDGTIISETMQDYSSAITAPANPVREGYTFTGWDTEVPSVVPAHDVTFTATYSINSYKLTYFVDGVEYKTFTIDYGTAITLEPAPTKEGHTFSGWSEIPTTMPAHDVEVTGTFSINSYTLTYLLDGEVYETETVVYGTPLTPEPTLQKEGYTFSGWSEIPATMPAHDVTVTGTFTVNSYKLTYIVDGEIYKTETVDYGTPLTPEPALQKEGYTFSGWSAIPETMPAFDLVVKGSFIINQYLLTYVLDGEEYKSFEIDYNSAITPISAPVKKGMTFSGWTEIPERMPAHDVTVTGTYSWAKETVDYVVYQVTDTLNNYASVIGYEKNNGEARILSDLEIDGYWYTVNDIADGALPQTVTIYVPVGRLLLILWNAGYDNILEAESGRELAAPEISLVAATASSLDLSYVNEYREFRESVVISSTPIEKGENGYEMVLRGLEPGKLYDDIGILTLTLEDVSYTKTSSFKTEALVLATQQPKVVSLGNVIVAAESNLDNEEQSVGFEWRRIDWTDDFASGTGAAYLYEGMMEGYIHNLNTEKLWKYRPYYESNSGTRYYGEWVGIDPSNASYFEPTVHTYSTITVTGNSVEVKGYAMQGTDNVTSQGFAYWTTSPISSRRKVNGIPDDATIVLVNGNVMTATLDNLEYDTEYCCVAFMTTSEGETFYGEQQFFKTNIDPDDIGGVKAEEEVTEVARYDLNGRRLSAPQKGINIIRYSDGTTRKVLLK